MSKRLQITLSDKCYEKLLEMTENFWPNKSTIIDVALDEFYATKYQEVLFRKNARYVDLK